MNKLNVIVLVVLVLAGCFNTELIAPDNAKIQVLSSEKPVAYQKQYRNWYLLWGAFPLYVTQPEELIKENNLVEVRVQTKDTVMDAIISFFSAQISLLPQTVIVEGNYAK
ncbi:hypothetical protein [Methylobacter sp.]|uniref:hypothetical protein n=1 Tax=Methylobacter sp. TaxID=2051955 RepID=UPI0011F4A2F7|nr:hypothetical protein [Methylobacter sp.]TAK59723.1 MAG: hypothetical protein EPO18_19685 [Methylobacter sp.]